MAVLERCEMYTNAMIDCSEMTLTEYGNSGIHTYRIAEILKRWDGILGIEITIRQRIALPADEE